MVFQVVFKNCSDISHINGTAIILFFRIPLALFGAVWAAAFPKNLDLSMKGLTAMDLGVGVLKGPPKF